MSVLPNTTYPQGGEELKAAIGIDLAQTGMFFQLLGRRAGRRPPTVPKGPSRSQAQRDSDPDERPESKSATNNAEDANLFEGLLAGSYAIEASPPSFTATQKSIALNPEQELSVYLVLNVSAEAQSVSVSAIDPWFTTTRRRRSIPKKLSEDSLVKRGELSTVGGTFRYTFLLSEHLNVSDQRPSGS